MLIPPYQGFVTTGSVRGNSTDIVQEKRLQQIGNSARSLQVLGEQSSVYVPMSNTPAKLPSYLKLDATSPWHMAALQVVGLESMTISSRLRSTLGGRGTLQDLEDTINSTGKRRIAKLEMSIADPDVLFEKALDKAESIAKVGSTRSRHTSEGEDELTDFDIDLFTRDYRSAAARTKKEHIFGRAEASRGEWTLSENSERDPHDRFDNGPVVQRYVQYFSLRGSPLRPSSTSLFYSRCATLISPPPLLITEPNEYLLSTHLPPPDTRHLSSSPYSTASPRPYSTWDPDMPKNLLSTLASQQVQLWQRKYARSSQSSSEWLQSRKERSWLTAFMALRRSTTKAGIVLLTATMTTKCARSALR